MLSAPSYSAVDILSALPSTTSSVSAVGINNAGTVALNTTISVTNGNQLQGYTYSARRHRAYRVPDIDQGNNAFEAVSNLVAINDKDQLATLSNVRNVDGTWSTANVFGITSLNYSGQAVGSAPVTFIPGPGWATQPFIFDPSSSQTTPLPSATFPPELGDRPLITDNGIIGARTYLYDAVSSTATALPAGDGNVSALSGHFAAGAYGHGFYLYDLRTGTQTVIASQTGESDFVPSGVNDDGTVVGTALFYSRVRNHTQRLQDAAVYANGTIYDLNSLVTAPTASRLASPTGINSSGQIIVNDAQSAHAYLLQPLNS